MPRKRILYSSPEELLNELITGSRNIKNVYIMRLRARNLYEDEEQFEIIDAALKMYQASRKIKLIDF
ncbi:hypothetical protein R7Q10_21815 [Vibrio sp. Vb0599]|uniref:hypothetical protein n=1 Tax=Vibrio sp. Vb0599 TaxID=3074628 RepID=UPI0029645682|nr:hypothetical protein [Vibrio sp. Vb0599]MDW1944669.1 hypothetical protein [Vibrio sp. Vb0599]